ncbi:hypothetical protein PA598K_03970 [Paenibacillus sp. 598K]|uniref:hypothetical protein n=1 Tax=Paenibacillus sp. 598K TaxID=1117987 RepID=UPI000FFA3968|nr:hypothetical protein [Paenibacillus sp. 598K]GBF75553.1 hypothetical protein PA598K_03970 [Paenibacillus sp. 598K]
MQKFEPDTFKQLQDAIVSGGDWSRILTGFARKAAARQDWAKAYQEEAAVPVGKLPVDNRFDQASRTDLTSFAQQIKDIINQAGLPNSKLLTDNIEAFMRKLQ